MEQQLPATIQVPASQQQVTAFSSMEGFQAAEQMARALISSDMVPKEYRGEDNLGSAIIALEIAQRMNASILMVMQNLYMVHGHPGWSAKYLIATFNQCGRFSAIRYEFKGTAGNKNRSCRAYAVEKNTNERVEGPVIDWPLIDAEGWSKRTGNKWVTMPEKMFQYRAAAWLIDTVAPELSMGLQTVDQLADYIDVDATTGEVLGTGKTSKNAPIKVINEDSTGKEPDENQKIEIELMTDDEFMNIVSVLQKKVESGQKTVKQITEWLMGRGKELTPEQANTVNTFKKAK